SEFQAHVAAAEHEQVFGNRVQLHDRRAIEKWNFLEALQLGHGWASYSVSEDAIRGKGALSAVFQADAHAFGAGEGRFSKDQIQIGRFFQALLAAVAKTIDDVALALTDSLHIDANVAGLDTVLLTAAGKKRDAPARQHRFRRSAALVDASPAYVASLDKRCPQARLCQRAAQGVAPLP